jgi:hypothetical protein
MKYIEQAERDQYFDFCATELAMRHLKNEDLKKDTLVMIGALYVQRVNLKEKLSDDALMVLGALYLQTLGIVE